MQKKDTGNLNSIRKEIQRTQLALIISITILLSLGGFSINIKFNKETLNQNLQNTAELITRIYSFTKNYDSQELQDYMDSVIKDLSDVDVVSIIDLNNIRKYHTHHDLINTEYDGTIPDFKNNSNYYTESNIGPSGPQLRTYSAVYDADGNYNGFIMTIRLKTSIAAITTRTLVLFLIVTFSAIFLEISISGVLSRKIKKEFLAFTEDFEGTKFLVDSMRANNHDFTNKLHVILGLIQIEQYDKAISYIQNISIIQRETISKVMNSIENPSFAALIVGKIARASECNVRFILSEGSSFKNADIALPSEALVTITGNLIDNALDSMNMDTTKTEKELTLGVYTRQNKLLIIVKDTGTGIPDELKEKIFENGFSTKGEGRGIGLYHTKQLITSLGGSITVESQVGIGTSFMVNL
ncbi:MAG: ATP-binding protein [Treponema sp.]|nr:ATP-binding protein [Spirochaetia bacterium]MDD7459908.1 ATP-binding protein [Spirochaetales bacterium]MDY5810433.1 ATP-binding protein [Treponema sp.]